VLQAVLELALATEYKMLARLDHHFLGLSQTENTHHELWNLVAFHRSMAFGLLCLRFRLRSRDGLVLGGRL
jgi:hypothetical protein